MERLKDSIVRVKALVDCPSTIICESTIEDLKILLDGLADRDISIKGMNFKTLKEIERDVKLAKIIVDEGETWTRGYDKGYQAGRDGEIAWRRMQGDD